jgi:hypothetical protein
MTHSHGLLTDYFDSFGYKRLSAVEVDPDKSNEHEFNGVTQMKSIFGPARLERMPCRVHYLCDDEERMISDVLHLTWYDAREKHPTRSEYRLYYTDSPCVSAAAAEDLMILCRNRDSKAGSEPFTDVGEPFTMFLSKANDTITAQLMWLFGISERQLSFRFAGKDAEAGDGLDMYSSMVLERIGIVLKTRDDALLEQLLLRFPGGFPATREFSAFARSLSQIDVHDSPDAALSNWLNLEDRAFRLFENHWLASAIEAGFANVDEFIRFSLSVQNRRKARAGYALENHLVELFRRLGIDCSYNVVTEHASRPDFIFPGIDPYRDNEFPVERLTMLGAKTTCKDRWRQVLAEATRIPEKHLCTLEPGISVSQTDEMQGSNLQLVVPGAIFSSYTETQQTWLMSISDFVALVKERQQPPQPS